MKEVSNELVNYLNTVKNMVSCDLFELRLADGAVYYFTNTDKSILYGGHTYRHDLVLVKRQQVKINDCVVVDTMTVNVYADKSMMLGSKNLFLAAHDGTLDMARMALKRCFFRDNVVVGVIGLFEGRVEVKACGGIGLELTVKADTQGLNQNFPIRIYSPQGSYTNNGGTVSAGNDEKACVVTPYIPRKEVLL